MTPPASSATVADFLRDAQFIADNYANGYIALNITTMAVVRTFWASKHLQSQWLTIDDLKSDISCRIL